MKCVYVVIEGGRVTITGHNLGGYELDQIVALGPDVTRAYAANVDTQSRWMEFLHTAGALVDFDRRLLLVFTTLPGPEQIPAFREALRRSWPDWTVTWAAGGVDDLADHLGPAAPAYQRYAVEPTVFSGPLRGDFVITVRDADGAFRASAGEYEDIAVGPALIDRVPATGPRSYQLRRGGIHIDAAARRVGVWTTSTYEGLALGWPRLWPGWTLVRWGADAQPHRDAVAGAVEIIEPPLDLDGYGARLDALWLRLVHELLSDPVYYAEVTVVDESTIRPFVAADLTEQAYRDLRERAVGSRHDAEEDRRARANARALRRRGWATPT